MRNTRPVVVWTVLIAYVVSTILEHKNVNEFFGYLVVTYGTPRYTFGIRLLTGIVGVIVLPFLVRILWKDPARFRDLLIVAPIALTIDQALIGIPVERIHYLQYGFLTALCYIAVGQQLPAALMAFVIGYIDEAHQYWLLYADTRTNYFDWNDITLNLLGILVVFFLLLPKQSPRHVSKKLLFGVIAGWVLTVVLLVSYYNPDRYLIRDDPYKGSSSFWIVTKVETYHVMNALQGMIFLGVILITITAYYWPDKQRTK